MRSRALVHRLVYAAEVPFDRMRRRLAGTPQRLTISTYLGHGSHEAAVVRGRVLAGSPLESAVGPEPVAVRVRRMASRFMTREVADVPLTVRVGDVDSEVVTDEEGYFAAELHGTSLPPGPRLREIEIEATGRYADLPTDHGERRIFVPEPATERLVISDIDDTVLLTGATNRWRMVLTTLTGSAWTRSAFPGVAELYEGLVHSATGVDHPCFYVSSSPWNLYDFLVSFLARTGLPPGPLHLRDFGVDEQRFIAGGHAEHKANAIEEILRIHDLPVVLSGDTGERDPEIFLDIIRTHGDRVDGVLLRHVAGPDRRADIEALYADVTVPLCLASDSDVLSEEAERAGLLPTGWTQRVRRAR